MKPKIDFSPGMWYTFPGDFMYNADIKERFLQSESKNLRYTQEGFRKAEPFETEHGKDLAEMTKEEAVTMMNSIGIIEDSSIRSTLTAFKNYVIWCEENHVFTTIGRGFAVLKPTDIDISESIKAGLFQNDFDFLTTLRTLRAFDEGYPEPPVLCLAWLGLKIKEILALQDGDVNMETRTISINGNAIACGFSDAIAQVLQEFIDCKVSERDHKTGWRQVIKDYSTDYFLKRMLPKGSRDFGKPIGYSQIAAALSRLNAKLIDAGKPPRLKFENVWNSGRYYQMWEAEQSGVDITAKENRLVVERIFRDAKGYYNAIRMYEAYKKAFGLM